MGVSLLNATKVVGDETLAANGRLGYDDEEVPGSNPYRMQRRSINLLLLRGWNEATQASCGKSSSLNSNLGDWLRVRGLDLG